MSRIIIKNLPSKVDEHLIRETFGQIGLITDVQLKYNASGIFRRFCFVGYNTAEEAQAAIKHFNNSCLGTAKLSVQMCANLGETAPFKKSSNNIQSIKPSEKEKTRKKLQAKSQIKDEELIDQIKKYKGDLDFIEFLEAHGKSKKILDALCSDDDNANEEKASENDVEDEKQNLAGNKILSDMEYLSLKKSTVKDDVAVTVQDKSAEYFKSKYFTVKISNLPYKAKRNDIIELFATIPISSLRMPPKIKGIAYVGFDSEKKMKQALIKNKSFLNGKRIYVVEETTKKKIDKQEKDKIPEKWKKQDESLQLKCEKIAESGRIFVRNIPYIVGEKELQELFEKYGPIVELIYPVDKITREHIGYGFVTYLMPQHAVAAYSALDGTAFHGRMLHLLPAIPKKDPDEEDDTEGDNNYKKNKEKSLKAKAGSSHNWNTLFLDMNSVAEIIAEKYNVSKEEILTGKDAAIRIALGETQLVSETRQFLIENGIKLDAFNQEVKARSKTIILVKNLPAKTTVNEIRKLFIQYGELGRVILPPHGITAIVEFLEPSEARVAFRKLAYSKFKHIPLYLEWAPENVLTEVKVSEEKSRVPEGQDSNDSTMAEEDNNDIVPENDTVLFVKNLNFDTTEEDLNEHFKRCGKIASVTVSRKKDLKKPGSLLSMGYGFVQFYFKSSLMEALKTLQGSTLQGHQLELKLSNRTLKEEFVTLRKGTNVSKQTGTKILVRNIPFQATKREIWDLFKTFGELKFVRLPQKLVGTGPHRGFAFVEYVTKHDAKAAMNALCQSTHLFGRRLVLEWAQPEDNVGHLMEKTARNFCLGKGKKKMRALADLLPEEDDQELF